MHLQVRDQRQARDFLGRHLRLVIQTQMPSLQKPVVSWSPGEPFVLPVVERTGTLLLHEVGSLSLHDQLQLLEWSASAMRRRSAGSS